MKKMMRKIVAYLLTVAAVLFAVCGCGSKTEQKKERVEYPFRELTGEEITLEMGAGWNLGNTMDGHTGFTPNETQWQDDKTTKALIRSVHDLGFNTIRVPVTWGTMIDDENGYAINEVWLNRVQDIVDYAVSQDMYVIINIHHDGAEQSGWLRIATDDKDALYEKFEGVWKNIAEHFKNYDEHLIFEAMNEVQGVGMTLAQENAVIMDLNQIFVDTVRATGSNNAKRWLVVCGKYNFINSLVNPTAEFELPNDTIENRIILSVHCYTTWDFCGTESTNVSTYSVDKLKNSNESELSSLEQFTKQGIPVIVGEYGCINKDNTEERAFFLEGMNRIFQKYHLIGIYWDQGWYDRSISPDYSFTIIDRKTGEPVDKEVTDAIIRGFYGTETSLDSLEHSPEIAETSKLTLEKSELKLKVGDIYDVSYTTTPEETDDIILFRTDDESVATVYNGRIRAKGVGETTITAYSLSGSVSETISVKVEADPCGAGCSKIVTAADELNLALGEYIMLDAATDGTDFGDNFSYRSMDETIVTVSTYGKVVPVATGETEILVTSSDGLTKTIPVTVGEQDAVTEITLALNVYYNDSSLNYFGNEVSAQKITVTESGEYTLTFDCNTDLSQAAKSAGVTNLNKLTAIYIKDYSVTSGLTTKSPLQSCDILYTQVKVNGTPLTINQTEPKSAIKSSGIFDTNDPVNSWDGSAVDEINCSNNVASFSTIENPTVIEVTFQLSNLVFE